MGYKGSWTRPRNEARYSAEYDRIFGVRCSHVARGGKRCELEQGHKGLHAVVSAFDVLPHVPGEAHKVGQADVYETDGL